MPFIRRLVIRISELLGILLIIFITGYWGIHAWSWAKTVRFVSDQLLKVAADLRQAGWAAEILTTENLNAIVQVSNFSEPKLWFVVGAFLGFVLSCSIVSIVFLLADIAHNTRKTMQFLERLESRMDNRPQT